MFAIETLGRAILGPVLVSAETFDENFQGHWSIQIFPSQKQGKRGIGPYTPAGNSYLPTLNLSN